MPTVTPLPGDFMVCGLTARSWIGRIESDAIRWGTDAPVAHAAVYIGKGKILQAEPGGAAVAPWNSHPDALWSTGRLGYTLTGSQRFAICTAAKRMTGRPYGWADIIAIALAQHRLGERINPKLPAARQPWWVRRLMDPHTVICSQLVVLAYHAAGVDLCPGMIPALVSPGDLWRILTAREVTRSGTPVLGH